MRKVTVSESVRFVDEREWSALMRDMPDAEWKEIDGRIASREELFARIDEALDLPEWFGRNWDALDEALRDLESRKTLVVRHAGSLWRDHPRDAATLLEIWLSAAEELSADRVELRLVFLWCDELETCCASTARWNE